MDSVSGLTGQTIGKYRIVAHLGRGGMAEVYKAYQPALDRYVALKLMHAFLASDQDFIGRFEREAKNVAALRHPNIIQVFDFDVHNGAPYMVMEYIEGGTLKSHMEDLSRAGTPLTLNEAVHTIREVGRALAYAHQRGMIHRDVKPANVLLDQGNRVILTDFGIAKILTGPSFTMTGATVGTPAYMSPEQSLGRPGDHRSDLYSLGVMLYQLATGQLPYDADTPLAVMLKHVNEPLPLPRSFEPNLPEGIERVILKAMAKNPDDRFQSADDMLAHLGDLDTATRLPIPPASMAAGADAHAATVSPGARGREAAPFTRHRRRWWCRRLARAPRPRRLPPLRPGPLTCTEPLAAHPSSPPAHPWCPPRRQRRWSGPSGAPRRCCCSRGPGQSCFSWSLPAAHSPSRMALACWRDPARRPRCAPQLRWKRRPAPAGRAPRRPPGPAPARRTPSPRNSRPFRRHKRHWWLAWPPPRRPTRPT
jgi:serine/threonine protein kinase